MSQALAQSPLAAAPLSAVAPERPATAARPGLPAFSAQPLRLPARDDLLDAPLLVEVLEALDTGVIVCNAEGRVALANDPARRELQRARLLAVDGSVCLQTPTVGSPCALQWRAALRGAVLARRRQLLLLRDENCALWVSVMPVDAGGQTWALLQLGRRQPAPELAVDMLAKQCQLTPAERQVLGQLLAGQRVDEVAVARGVKLSTLRTQVVSLRAKLGADRIEDLVRIVAELPPMTGVLRCPPLVATAEMSPAQAA